MEILWLTENYPPQRGGMAQSCDRITGQLKKEGLIVHVLHFTNKRPAFQTETKWNGSYTALPKYQDMAHALHLGLTFLERNSFEASAMVAFGGLYPLSAIPVYSKILELPYYVCLRGNDFDIGLFNPKKKTVLDQALQSAKGIMTNSTDKVKRIQLLYHKNVYFTPNGIDLDSWLPLKSELDWAENWRGTQLKNNQQCVGLFGFLKEKKGVLFFLKALKKSGNSNSVHLLFSGDLDSAVMEYLENQSMEYTQLPFLNRTELIQHYLCCDWLAIPSFYEGMPNVLLEGGGLGIPVLASAIDGMKDVIEHLKTGMLFETLNLQDCSLKISNMLQMEEKSRKHLGEALRQHLENTFTLEKEAKSYQQIFKKDGI